MPEFSGSALVVQWIHPSGTVALTADSRSLSIEPTVKLYTATAGSDADEVYLSGIKDAKISWSGVAQTSGTALEDALVEGTSGTLIVGPEGTASGKRKYTIPAFSMGLQVNIPYDNVVELSCDWQKTGAMTRGTY